MPTIKIFDLPLTAKSRNLIHLLETWGYLICGTRWKVKDSNMRQVVVRARTLFSWDSYLSVSKFVFHLLMDLSSSCCILAYKKSSKILHLHPSGRRTLRGELLQMKFSAGVDELQEWGGQAPEPHVFCPEWLEMREEFTCSYIEEFHTVEVRRHIQGKVGFNILIRIVHLSISCFRTVTQDFPQFYLQFYSLIVPLF